MSERVLYEETYRKGTAKIRTDLLPERLPYFAEGSTMVSMEMRKAGCVEIDGEEFEFQDIHVIVRPPKR
jgi:hypothetical protein